MEFGQLMNYWGVLKFKVSWMYLDHKPAEKFQRWKILAWALKGPLAGCLLPQKLALPGSSIQLSRKAVGAQLLSLNWEFGQA